MDQYALVTGASKGIGKAFANQLAAKGYQLLLTARSGTELNLLAESLTATYGVQAFYLACDLAQPGSPEQLATWCQEKTNALTVLVNNAGYGLAGHFNTLPIADQLEMLQLNVNTVVELSHLLLPVLKKQPKAYILNVSSTAAYQAMPSLAVYAATKVFVLSFSRALRFELKNSSVSLSCLCPGPTDTGFARRAGLEALVELADKFNMQPSDVARIGIQGMFAGKAEIIPGLLNKLSAFASRHLPKGLIEKITAGLYER